MQVAIEATQRDLSGLLSQLPEGRLCSDCGRFRPLDAFHNSKRKSRTSKGWMACAECRNKRQRQRYASDEGSRIKSALRHIKNTYGLTASEFLAMMRRQRNLCGSCGDDMGKGRNRHIDHCHTTGRVRELLCNRCNSALGLLKEDPARMRALLTYLERHSQP